MFEREVRQAEFEKVRSQYNEENACELHRDMKNGIDVCEKSSCVNAKTFSYVASLIFSNMVWLLGIQWWNKYGLMLNWRYL